MRTDYRYLPLLVPLLLPLLLAGCGTQRAMPVHYPAPLPVHPVPLPVARITPPDEVAPLLAYHQSLRRMTQGELLKELSGLLMQQRTPKLSLQIGMNLMLTRGGGDLPRAQAQFDSVAASTDPAAQGLRPLAQLLSSYCAEARRLGEHAERLSTQLKETQRKSDQLNETLEALKAIERGLPVRPSGGPAGGAR